MGVNGIYGLSGSGLDIESLVKVGMMKTQKEYDKMAQKYTKNEWTKAAYIELNDSITTFNMSTLTQYKMSSNMNAKTAESSSSAVKVDANASAPIMSHKVEVESLSSAAYLISNNKLTRYGSNSSSIALKDILFQKLKYDATTETVTNSTTLPPVGTTASVLSQTPNGYQTGSLSYKDKAISFYINDGTSTENGGKGVEISFTYEEIINGSTLNDLASRINGKGLNIKANYDTVQDQFSLYNVKGGADNTIKISTGANSAALSGLTNTYAGSVGLGLINGLGLTQIQNGDKTSKVVNLPSVSTPSSDEITGTNGKIIVDGMEYTTTDNKANVGGIIYTAMEKTSQAVNVTVTQDVDAIVDKVKSFVEDYNKLLSSLYAKYDEKRESGYEPLTQSQKDAMKEEQITKWEEKAKKGLLYHDQTLGKIINEMRESINSPVDGIEGKYNSAYSIGISTLGSKGRLTLNEDKLRAALAEDSNAVYNIFAKLDDGEKVALKNADGSPMLDSDGKQVYKTVERSSYNGVAQRLGDIFTTAQKTIKSRAGSSSDITEDSDLNTLLRNLQTKMSDFKKMMSALEDALYKKYDKMEQLLASLGTQMNFLFSDQ